MRKINYIIVHCSATEHDKPFHAKDIDAWHRAKGWNGIGYHKVIDLDGIIENGRPIEKIGAHCQGHNSDSIGVCYIGGLLNGIPWDTRTGAQKSSLLLLLKQLKQLYPNAKIVGHRDMPGVHKACPCFDAKEEYKDL